MKKIEKISAVREGDYVFEVATVQFEVLKHGLITRAAVARAIYD